MFVLVNKNTGKRLGQQLNVSQFVIPSYMPYAGTNLGDLRNLSDENLLKYNIAKYVVVKDEPSSLTVPRFTETYDAETNTLTNHVSYEDKPLDQAKVLTLKNINTHRDVVRNSGMEYQGPIMINGVLVEEPTEVYNVGTTRLHQNDLNSIKGSFEAGSTKSTGFRLGTGIIIPLPDLESTKALMVLGGDFIQDCFIKEAELEAMVLAAETVEDVRAINDDIETLFVVDNMWYGREE